MSTSIPPYLGCPAGTGKRRCLAAVRAPVHERVRRGICLTGAASCVVVLALAFQGCATLILRDEDQSAATTGKVVARVVLGLATLGFSEVFIEAEKERELENMLIPVTEKVRQGELRLPRAILLIGTHRRATEVVRMSFARLGVHIQEIPPLAERLTQEAGQSDASLELQTEARDVGLRNGMDEVVFVVTRAHRVSLEAISVETGDLLWVGRAYSPGRENEPAPGDDVIERLAAWAFGRVWCAEGAWNTQTGCQHMLGGY